MKQGKCVPTDRVVFVKQGKSGVAQRQQGLPLQIMLSPKHLTHLDYSDYLPLTQYHVAYVQCLNNSNLRQIRHMREKQGWKNVIKIKTVWHGFRRIFETVWQGESGERKTVCWFSKYCRLDFLNISLCCKLPDLINSGGIKADFVQQSKSVWIGSISLFHNCLPPQLLSVKWETL